MSFFSKLFKKKEKVEQSSVQEEIEKEAELEAEQEAAEREAELKAEQEAAEREAELKAEQEAAEREAELKAEQEAAEREAELKAEQEVAEREAELKAEQEAAEREAELKAEQEAAEREAELKAEEEVAEREAELKAEQEAAEREAELKAEQEAAEREAELKAEQEAAEREAELKAEQEAAEREAELKAEEEAAEREAELQVEQEASENEIEKPQKKGLFSKLFSGLTKTRDNLLHSVDEVLKSFKKIDEELYEELEEALIIADFGVDTTLKIMEDLRKLVKERKIVDPALLKDTLAEIITTILTSQEVKPIMQEGVPNVILVIGVNGAGKTTTIGKLSNQLKEDGHKVMLAAADTFRAAAIEQLQIWANRAGVDLIKHDEGSDPAAVVYDGIQAAKARKADVLICDTAGRLQNKTNLMKELEKISRIIEREYPEAHKEVLIVLDATTGQNAISQVKVFKEAAHVDGIVLTKLDGTAKGGAIVGICQSMNVPVKYIGVGEKIEDLQVFDPENFAKALFTKDEN